MLRKYKKSATPDSQADPETNRPLTLIVLSEPLSIRSFLLVSESTPELQLDTSHI